MKFVISATIIENRDNSEKSYFGIKIKKKKIVQKLRHSAAKPESRM